MSKKYQNGTLPITGLNGKLAPSDVICHNVTSESDPFDTYVYGFTRNGGNKTYFGYRTRPRNLNNNPYTANELRMRNLFRSGVNYATWVMSQPGSALYETRKEEYNASKSEMKFYNWLISYYINTFKNINQ